MASVLLIEDDIRLATVLSQALRQSGHRVRHILDGRNVQRIVAEERFDVIVTDIIMPEKDGFEVICELRRSGVQTPIVVMSGDNYAMMFGRMAQRVVRTAFLPKPFSLSALNLAVEEAVQSSAVPLSAAIEA